MFHVKHQNKGFFFGVPMGRGNCLSVGRTFTRTSYPAPYLERPWALSPRIPRPEGFHRFSVRSLGGSDTISTPPTSKNRTAHSAVTAGGPKDRAVTRSNLPSNSGQRAASSARAVMTSQFCGAPGHARDSLRNLLLLIMESRKTPEHFQRSTNTSPGSPPPLPRSSRRAGGVSRNASQHFAKPSAWTICGSMG